MVKKAVNSFLILACILLAIGCNNKKQSDTQMTLNVGVMPSMDYLPLALAQQQGYFEQEGIKVNLQKFFSANERDAAIQSNNLDGSILDYTGAAIQRAGGVNLHLVSKCDGTFELVARDALNIKEDVDLKNKNYAVSRNTVIDFCTDMLLASKGIKVSEIQKSEINKIPLRLEMLRNDKVDLTVLPDPFATIAKSSKNSTILSLKDLGFNVTGIVFSGKAIEEKSSAIESFLKAYNLAVKDLQEKPVTDFKDLLVSEIGFPEELIAGVELPNYTNASLPENSDLEAVEKWLKEREVIKPDFDINSLVYRQFLEGNNNATK